MDADFELVDQGSIIQVIAKTDTAKDWINENVEAPDYMWNGTVLNVERRFAPDLVHGMLTDGMVSETN